MQRQKSIVFDGINSDTPQNEILTAKYIHIPSFTQQPFPTLPLEKIQNLTYIPFTSDPGLCHSTYVKKFFLSFAYYTVKDRLPVILTKVINELATNKGIIIKTHGEAAEEDLKSVIGKISKLKNELVTNKSLLPLCSNGSDVKEWNDYLESQSQLGKDLPCWYYSPWLYIECYMYRRLWEAFETSQTLQDLDPFSKQKEEAFDVLVNEIKVVGKITLNSLNQINKLDLKKKFVEFMKLSLWSNRCDLSLTNGSSLSEDDCNLSNVNALDKFLLCDDSVEVFGLLKESPGVIDFVTDNSSYEIFSDFCFCDFLCSSSLVSKIRFHVKKLPWYVSDVMKKDINWLFNRLEKEGLRDLSKKWEKYCQDGIWTISDENYWTLPFDYNEMNVRDVNLYNSLSTSKLVIFKGDLNYRKLLGDINWDPCEKFETALRHFHPTNVLTLRTVKSDLICGLKQEVTENLNEGKMWMRTGEYAVIQFYKHE